MNESSTDGRPMIEAMRTCAGRLERRKLANMFWDLFRMVPSIP